MKAISKQLQNPLSEDILKVRIEKDVKARNEISEAVSSGEYYPEDARIIRDEDPSTWISASGLTDAFLHRLSCRIVVDGRQSIYKEIIKLRDSNTFDFILNILNMGEKVGNMLRGLLEADLRSSSPDSKSGLSDIMAGLNNHNNPHALTTQLLDYWSKRVNNSNRSRSRLRTSEEGAKVLSSRFLHDIEYAVSEISDHIRHHVVPTRESGVTFESVYCSSTNTTDLDERLDCLTNKGITGVFQQIYSMTKGYSNPMCRSCLYSPRTKTFWYALRPITLSCDIRNDIVTHTFDGIWIQWNPTLFAESMATYSENAIKMIRTGDLTEESCSSSHFHPHVGEHGNICLGGAGPMFTLASKTLALSASMDIVISVLNDYARGDAYSPLKRFTMNQEQWEEECRDDDDCDDDEEGPYCEECGEEVNRDDDVYEDGMWFHHEGCCHYSDWEGRYIGESNAVYSEHYDSYISDYGSVHTCPISSCSDCYSADDSDNICQLWIPDTWDVFKELWPCNDYSFTMYDMGVNPSENDNEHTPGGCIMYICTEDVATEVDIFSNPIDTLTELDIKDCKYVPLSSIIYHHVANYHRSTSHIYEKINCDNIWGRIEDCVCVMLNTIPDIKHYVLKYHLEGAERSIIARALAPNNLLVAIQGPIKYPTKIKETEEIT